MVPNTSVSGLRVGATAVTLTLFLLFSALTYLGNFHAAWLNVASLGMLLLPLIWAWRKGTWREMGFSRADLPAALRWGVGGGVLSSLVGVWVIGAVHVPENLALELAVAIPIWLLIASPFQEFFFRGWMQTRLAAVWGRWMGFALTLLCFTLWHYALPIFGPQSAFPMLTLRGIMGTVASGFVYGFVFLRTGSLVAPWLAHAIPGIVFVVIGTASFLTAL
jgi:membrane protease YdiL (CAAX protease family)